MERGFPYRFPLALRFPAAFLPFMSGPVGTLPLLWGKHDAFAVFAMESPENEKGWSGFPHTSLWFSLKYSQLTVRAEACRKGA